MIGLDFGTTNSCAAFTDVYLGEVHAASVAPLNTSPYDSVLASSVLYPLGSEPILGIQAERAYMGLPTKEQAEVEAHYRFLSNFKRSLNASRLVKRVRVIDKIIHRFDGLQQINVDEYIYRDEYVGEGFPRENLVAAVTLLVDRMLAGALDDGGELDRLLIGTPVAFSSRARKRMIAALGATGHFESYKALIEMTRFIPEPVAAAAAGMREAIDPKDHEAVLVFDHGGGTLDLSLIEFEQREGFDFPVPTRELGPATGADGVAGQAFDWALRDELCESGQVRHELEALQGADAIARVRDVKEKLSIQESAPLALLDSEVTVTRAQLEIAAAPLLGQIEQQIRRQLARAGLGTSDVDRILMTGGSSLIPCVQEKVRELFPELAREGKVRAYDPAVSGDVERAITEIAQGLALLGGDEADLRRMVMWDIELMDSEGRRFSHVARKGDSYEIGQDGRPELRKTVPIRDANKDGMSLGVWEARLNKRSFLFGIAEIPPTDEDLELEVVLRPDALYPILRVRRADGSILEREETFGWEENRRVAADIGLLSDGQLGEFFDQDEVDYVPTAPFLRLCHAPLTRLIGLGDIVEWVEHRTKGRSAIRRAGEVVGIRKLGSHAPLETVEDFTLKEHAIRVRLESTGGVLELEPTFGAIRIRPIA